MSVTKQESGSRRWLKIVAASACLAFSVATGPLSVASTQDSQPATPPAKAPAATAKTSTAAKTSTSAKTAPVKKAPVKPGAKTCEPGRKFVPVNKNAGVCAPPVQTQDGQKFNTVEDIYVPPASPAEPGT